MNATDSFDTFKTLLATMTRLDVPDDLAILWLTEVEHFLVSLAPTDIAYVSRRGDLLSKMQLLSKEFRSREQKDIITSIYNIILRSHPLTELLLPYNNVLLCDLFSSGNDAVIAPLLERLQFLNMDPGDFTELTLNFVLLEKIMWLVDSSVCFHHIQKLLLAVGCTTTGVLSLCHPSLLHCIRTILSPNSKDTSRCRMYQLIVELCQISEKLHSCYCGQGFIQRLISELKAQDTELQANLYKILTKFSISKHCFDYLRENYVFQEIWFDMRVSLNSDEVARLPSMIYFVADVTRQHPEEMIYYNWTLVSKVLNLADYTDSQTAYTAVAAIITICTSTDAKIILNRNETVVKSMLNSIKQMGMRSAMSSLVLALKAVSMILTIKESNDEPGINAFLPTVTSPELKLKLEKIHERWFRILFPHGLDEVLNVKQDLLPIVEVQVASLQFIFALSNQKWGHKIINETPGCVEMLLDRTTRVNDSYSYIQYATVKRIMKLAAEYSVFNEETLNRLVHFITQGINYFPTSQSAVT